MDAEIIEKVSDFVKLIAANPEIMTNPEKRNVLAKMAKRIAAELKAVKK